jgi:hypothetical protein
MGLALPLASCSIDYRVKHYSCEGIVTEYFFGKAYGGYQENQTKERISISVYKNEVILAGNTLFHPLVNLALRDNNENLRQGVFSICSKDDRKISFDNYGCDFEKNVMLSSFVVSEGVYNGILDELTINQFRKYANPFVERLSSRTEMQGVYSCKLVKK